MNVIKYLRKAGYDTVNGEFYGKISEWKSWYEADVSNFHHYKIYNGRNRIKCRRLSLGMAKKLCEDIADLLLNEKVLITIEDEETHEYVMDVLKKNNFDVLGNEYQERKAYTGTVAYVPYLDDIRVDENGYVVNGYGTVKINYVSAEDIYPLTWDNGYITECAFVFHRTIKSKSYVHIQIHKLVDGKYDIENHIVENTNGSGREVQETEWKELPGFASLAPVVHTGLTERQFVIDKLNISNNYSSTNPMGVAIFANAIDVLQGLDIIYDSYINEFVLGKKRIFVAPEMLSTDLFGRVAFDPNDVAFYQLPEDTLKDGHEPIKEVNMNIRSEDHERGINNSLNILSCKCGFGQNHYKFDSGNIQTATQVISENSDMYRSMNKHEIILESVLKELIRIIARLGQMTGVNADPDSEIVIEFDDSIIEDKSAERQQDRSDMAAGVMTKLDYRMKWYGETEEEAQKHIVQDESVIE